MNLTDVATVVIAAVAVLGLILAGMGWLFKRGADERELAKAVRDNSEATRGLSARLDAFMARYEERHEALAERVNEHGGRLSIVEERTRANTTDIARLWPSPGMSRPAGDPIAER
jgi:hypothetical protein